MNCKYLVTDLVIGVIDSTHKSFNDPEAATFSNLADATLFCLNVSLNRISVLEDRIHALEGGDR
jgi:hypothetical protein